MSMKNYNKYSKYNSSIIKQKKLKKHLTLALIILSIIFFATITLIPKGYKYETVFFIIFIIITLLVYILLIEKRCNNLIKYLSSIDEVTNYENYAIFSLNAIKILNSKNHKYAYVLFDIDNFKYINDVYGFSEGNKVLCHIADILSDYLEKDELFARKAKDYFSIIMKYENDSITKYRLENLAKKLTNISTSHQNKYNLIINFGVYKINNQVSSLDTISDRAKITLNTVKGGHRSLIAFYSENIRKKMLKEVEIEHLMHEALKNREFKIYLQPKYSLENDKIIGAEALVRWIHPLHGMIPPIDFISIFERNGFITKIDMYIFNEVCKKIKEWIDNGKNPIPISVNQSRINLNNPSYIKDIILTISKHNIPHNLIEIEITESALNNNPNHLIDIIKKLKSIGFLISLDDFGSGYSSLNLLKDIPVDIIKLDREFFNNTSNINNSKIVISSIVNMAKQLNIKVICEGVETSEQALFLKDIKCDMAQGYLFAKPMTINEFEDQVFD